MSITVSPTVLEKMLEAVFSGINDDNVAPLTVDGFAVFSGTRPPTVDTLAGVTDLTGVYTLPAGSFSPISNNTAVLTTPVVFTPSFDGIPSFIRFYNANTPVFDIDIGGTPGVGIATIDSTPLVTATENYITNIGFVFGNNANLQVSGAIAAYFLERFTNPITPVVYDSFKLAAASTLNPDTGSFDRTLSVIAYNGTMPAGDVPVVHDGVNMIQMWEVTLTPENLFTIGGNSMSLTQALTAIAYAEGTPTFVAITKAGFTGTLNNFPDCSIYVKVGDAVVFNPPTFVNTENATLTSLNLTFGDSLVTPEL